MKKISILLVFMTVFVLGADTLVFYVDTPEMVDMYFLIFSAIGRIFSSGEYLDLLRMTFLLGGFLVFAGGIFTSMNVGSGGEGALGGYLKYLIIGVSLLTLLFWDTGSGVQGRSTVDILIKSKTFPDICDPTASETAGTALSATTSGMPTILSYAFYFTNKVGTTLTDLAVESYSTVYGSELQGMNKNGGYMGSLKGAMQLMSIDPRKISLRSNNSVPSFDYGRVYKSLFTDCILVPYSAKGVAGEQKIAELKASSDLTSYLRTLFDGAGVMVGNTNSRDYSLIYGGEVYTCGAFYDNVIKPMDLAYKQILPCSIPIGYGAVGLVTGAVSAADVPSNFSEVAIQAGLVSQLEDSTSDLGVGVSGVSYASGKTRAEFIQSSLASGSYMADMLPYLQMTIRAILYAFFPFVFVIILLPGGLKVLGNYFQSLLWIELWTPTAAILDLFMSSQATKDLTDIYSNQGYTMMSSVDMLSAGSTIAGVAGYLYLSVPALTWLILKGSAQMMQGITSATAAGMASNIKSEMINKDVETVNKQQEMNARSGKDLSIAESQHYEAVQSGRKSGAEIGFNMKTGLNTVTDMQVSQQASSIEEYKSLKEVTGQGGESQGKSLGDAKAIKAAVQLETGNQSVGTNGSLNSRATDSIDSDVNKNVGEMEAKQEILKSGGNTKQHFAETSKTQTTKAIGANKAREAYTEGDMSFDGMNEQADNIARQAQTTASNSDVLTGGTIEGATTRGEITGKHQNRATRVTEASNNYKDKHNLGAEAEGRVEAITKKTMDNQQKAEANLGVLSGEMKNKSQAERDRFQIRQAMLNGQIKSINKDGDVETTSYTTQRDENGMAIISHESTQAHNTYSEKDRVLSEVSDIAVKTMALNDKDNIRKEELEKSADALSKYTTKLAADDSLTPEERNKKGLKKYKELTKTMNSNIQRREKEVDKKESERRKQIQQVFSNLKEAKGITASMTKSSIAAVVVSSINKNVRDGKSTDNVAKDLAVMGKTVLGSAASDATDLVTGNYTKEETDSGDKKTE